MTSGPISSKPHTSASHNNDDDDDDDDEEDLDDDEDYDESLEYLKVELDKARDDYKKLQSAKQKSELQFENEINKLKEELK